MRKSWIQVGALVFVGAVAPNCQKSETETTTTRTMSANDPRAPGTEKSGAYALSEDDREFMTKAAQGGMLEVEMGRQVAKNANVPDVKAFGERMAADHGKSNDELQQLAARKGVVLPSEMDSKHKSKVNDVTKLSGTELVREYVDEMVDDHENDVKEFRKASQEVKDPDLRAWAAKTLPTLESHLAHVRDLKSKMDRTK